MKLTVHVKGCRPARSLLLAGLSILLMAATLTRPAYLVKDINTAPGADSGAPSAMIATDDSLYFTFSGRLWKSDGTAAGTRPVAGTGTIGSGNFKAVLGNALYFTASDGGYGQELWRTGGTLEETRMVRDINPGRGDSGIRDVVPFRGELYFGANDGTAGFELWKTDGTSDGTVLAADLNPGRGSSALFSLKASGDRLYFSESSSFVNAPATLYSTDGTVSGTRLVRQFVAESTATICAGSCFGSPPGDFVSFGGLTYFVASDGISGLELWRTDGTSVGTTLVKDICPGKCSAFSFSVGIPSIDTPLLQVANGRLFFFASDGARGRELWTSDGTEAGTRLVKDISPGPSDSSFYGYGMTAVGPALLFPATDGHSGSVLWRSDGTEAGTFLVTDSDSGKGISTPDKITSVGNAVFFTAGDASGKRRLWKMDSAGSTASIVSDLVSNPTGLAGLGGALYFTAPGSRGLAFWKSDGSPEGTGVVLTLSQDNASSNPAPLAELNGALIFAESSGLWRSDGTDAGTRLVTPVDLAGSFIPFRGSLFFSGSDGVSGAELWRTDGTSGGTQLVKDIAVPGGKMFPWLHDSYPGAFAVVGDTLYFAAFDGDRGWGLWKTDGTADGTVLLKDVSLTSSVPFNGFLYFSGMSSSSRESGLWRTDGTSPGTQLVASVGAANLATFAGKLVFAGSDTLERYGLWTSDGTASGTVFLKAFPGVIGPFSGSLDGLFFMAAGGLGGIQLWRTDGTPGGTTPLADFLYGPVGYGLVTIGNRAFFAGEDAEHGVELWTSDGTTAGTRMVKDIAPGAADAYPGNLTVIGDVLLFTARDPVHGIELWRSDGTEEGTFLIQDIFAGPGSSSPWRFLKAGSLIYFTADDGETGVELWALPIAALDSVPRRKPREPRPMPWRR